MIAKQKKCKMFSRIFSTIFWSLHNFILLFIYNRFSGSDLDIHYLELNPSYHGCGGPMPQYSYFHRRHCLIKVAACSAADLSFGVEVAANVRNHSPVRLAVYLTLVLSFVHPRAFYLVVIHAITKRHESPSEWSRPGMCLEIWGSIFLPTRISSGFILLEFCIKMVKISGGEGFNAPDLVLVIVPLVYPAPSTSPETTDSPNAFAVPIPL